MIELYNNEIFLNLESKLIFVHKNKINNFIICLHAIKELVKKN